MTIYALHLTKIEVVILPPMQQKKVDRKKKGIVEIKGLVCALMHVSHKVTSTTVSPRRSPPQLSLQPPQTSLPPAHSQIHLNSTSPLFAPPLHKLLADVCKAASPPEANLHQSIDVQHTARARLHDLEDFHGVVYREDLALGGFEDG